MKNISMMIVLVSGILFGMASCGPSKQERHRLSKLEKARQDSLDSAAIKVAVLPTLDCLPVYVAYDDSLFKSQGVLVHLRRYTAQMDCDTAIARKRVEATVSDLFRTARLERKGVGLFYPISTNLYWQLITNKKARISDLKQLSDKMIAMTRYSGTDYLADLAVETAKPKYDVYRVQINDLGIRLRMLLNNEMDAMLLPEPQATKARLAQHVVLMDSRDKNLQPGVIAFRDVVRKNASRQQQLKLFLKAYDAAVDSINKNGLQHYADQVIKYCGVDAQTVKQLPRLKYEHAMEPRKRDLDLARSWVK